MSIKTILNKIIRSIGVVVSLALLIVPQTGSFLSTPPALDVIVVPNTIELGVGKTAQAQIVVRNPSSQTALHLALSWINNTSLLVTSENTEIDELLPNAEAIWNLQVSQPGQALDTGKINLRLDYAWVDSDAPESKPVSRFLFSELQVTIPAVEAVTDVADVKVQSTLTSLNEQQPGFVYLVLENKSDVPLRIQKINPIALEYLKVDTQDDISGAILYSHEKRIIPYQTRVTDVIQPGKNILLFEIDLAWEKNGQTQVGTLIATHELDIGVFGESEILKLLGIPAFFLLPGFLMIIAFRFLWKRGKTTEEAVKFPLATASDEFLFIAISLSLLMTALYPPLTNILLGARRNYLEAYGLVDVLYLWFGSILLAISFYILYFGIKALVDRYHKWLLIEKTPTVDDSPEVTIRRLKRNNLDLCRNRVLIQKGGQECWVFLLQKKRVEQQTYWVAPQIIISNRQNLEKSVEDTVCELLKTGKEIGVFLRASNKLTLEWVENWYEPGPYLVNSKDIIQIGPEQVMVGFE
jgi:hypothetical protein